MNLGAIVGLLAVIAMVLRRLPNVDIGHSAALVARRRSNWIVLGLAYAFLYFGRYNLSAIVGDLDRSGLLTKEQFNAIDGVGLATYGIAFLLNGPLADRWGGRQTILLATGGSAVMNLGMGWVMNQLATGMPSSTTATSAESLRQTLLILNAANMYFQSFGAVSIVKVNAHWFHVRERGVLGGMFGILISLGLYFSYDWSLLLYKNVGLTSTFVVPGLVLLAACIAAALVVRDSPSRAGFEDFDTGDATSGQTHADPLKVVLKKMLSQKAVLIMIAIEACSGFLRQAVMKQYRPYAAAIGQADTFVYQNWGLLLCIAGILGGIFAGTISDVVFHSRRGPVASILYAGMLAGTIVCAFTLGSPALGWSIVFISLCVIGVHGMLSGTASADFGGTRNAGVVTGVIDGFVYIGSATQAFVYRDALPKGLAARDPSAWASWPQYMIPVALVGLVLCAAVWNAKPKSHAAH